MGYKVAIAGATGNVGREILNILHERNFPADEVIPLASEASIGKVCSMWLMFWVVSSKCKLRQASSFGLVNIHG